MPEETPIAAPLPPARVRPARSYVWRLLPIVPALAIAFVGYRAYTGVPVDDGTVHEIKVTTKGDIAGQAREAYDSVMPTTADLYVAVRTRGKDEPRKLPVYKDTPLGNGLTWRLDPPIALRDVQEVQVWDQRRLIGDKQLDRIAFFSPVWSAKGQTFQIDLLGTQTRPPPWALPVLAAGATLAGLVLLRFVWDQAV